jgi:hypothetical protein
MSSPYNRVRGILPWYLFSLASGHYVDERLEGDATIRLIGGLIVPGQHNILLLLEIYNAITLYRPLVFRL